MGLALFSMAMFFAMLFATIHGLRNESRDRRERYATQKIFR
ncbi:hypothetical protein [Ensifer adhaerens]|nr:hypothetical protein [Ensifer adhaerens]